MCLRNFGYLAAAAVLACLAAAPCQADIIFELGNHPQPDEMNILFGGPETGNPITGEVDHTGVGVLFSSLTDTLNQKAQGQADIFATDGDVNNISVSVPGHTFTDFILNLQNGSGDATVTVESQGDVFTYTLGNGQNFLTILAENGQQITSISVDAPGGFTDFKQPRISGVSGVAPPIPEPASLALLVTGALGLAGYGWRRRQATA
jgi:hypothetical protein